MPVPSLPPETWEAILDWHATLERPRDLHSLSLVSSTLRPLAQKHIWRRIDVGIVVDWDAPESPEWYDFSSNTHRRLDRLRESPHLGALVEQVSVYEPEGERDDTAPLHDESASTLFEELYAVVPRTTRWLFTANLTRDYPALFGAFVDLPPPRPLEHLHVGEWNDDVRLLLSHQQTLKHLTLYCGLDNWPAVPVINLCALQSLHLGPHYSAYEDAFPRLQAVTAASHRSLTTFSSDRRSLGIPAAFAYLRHFSNLR
ncbi:hypothetical protein JCM8097_008306 [Rhodosporidiobolus ruineniae]